MEKKTVSGLRVLDVVRLLDLAMLGDGDATVDLAHRYAVDQMAGVLRVKLESVLIDTLARLAFTERGRRVLGYGRKAGRPPKGTSRETEKWAWIEALQDDFRSTSHTGLSPDGQGELKSYFMAIFRSPAKVEKLQAELSVRGRGRPKALDPFSSNVELYLMVEEARQKHRFLKTAYGHVADMLHLSDLQVRSRYEEFKRTPEYKFVVGNSGVS